jgi:hypothetical protein
VRASSSVEEKRRGGPDGARGSRGPALWCERCCTGAVVGAVQYGREEGGAGAAVAQFGHWAANLGRA